MELINLVPKGEIMEHKVKETKIEETLEIDKTTNGRLSVSITVIQKLIHDLLTSENYHVDLKNIKVISKENTDLETQVEVMVNKNDNLIDLKDRIISLILKRIDAILNVNITNINLIFAAK